MLEEKERLSEVSLRLEVNGRLDRRLLEKEQMTVDDVSFGSVGGRSDETKFLGLSSTFGPKEQG